MCFCFIVNRYNCADFITLQSNLSLCTLAEILDPFPSIKCNFWDAAERCSSRHNSQMILLHLACIKCTFCSRKTTYYISLEGEYLISFSVFKWTRFAVGGVMLPFEIAELVRWLVSLHAEEETQWWLTQRHQRCGRACSRPRSALQTDLRSIRAGGGGVAQILRGQAHSLHGAPACRPSRSWETSQLDFEPWRQNFEANTGGKLPNHVFHLSSLSQIPLQMFEQTAPLFLKLLVSCVCGCVSTVSIYESLRCCLWSVFVRTIESQEDYSMCLLCIFLH